MQGREVLLHYPPQPEDREMAEEEEADPQVEEEEDPSEDEGEESIPPADSGEDFEDEEEEEVLVRKRRCEAQTDEGASSATPTEGSSGAQPLETVPLRTAPPAAKRKKYALPWGDWPEGTK